MLARCANPICGAHFRYLKQGRIYNVPLYGPDDRSCKWPQRVEHFWLCSNCCVTLRLVWRNGKAEVQERHPLLTDGHVPETHPELPSPLSRPAAA
jgi:hypothetical protein